MPDWTNRREFLRYSVAVAAATGMGCDPTPGPQQDASTSGADGEQPWFRISLAEWSLHRALRDGSLDNLGFITAARRDYDIDAVEYVNTFFNGRAEDIGYLREVRDRCDAEGVASVLIMCDGEGRIGDPDPRARNKAVRNHHKWVHAARFLGCHAIRVNAASDGPPEQQSRFVADGLNDLARFAAALEISVLVENHGGLSSNAAWLASTIRRADHPNLGTLPDFGNFNLGDGDTYDAYLGVEELMPLARAVSAKSHDFDDAGNETTKDYVRLMRIVRDAGYRGRVGIEYEGDRLSEPEGVRLTKALLERCRAELADGA